MIMKLRDDTLAETSQTGVTVRTNFDVKPDDYIVRLVVRDSNAAQLVAESGSGNPFPATRRETRKGGAL